MLASGVQLSRRSCWDLTALLRMSSHLFHVAIHHTLAKLLLKFAKSRSDRMSFRITNNSLPSALFSERPQINAKFSERCFAGFHKESHYQDCLASPGCQKSPEEGRIVSHSVVCYQVTRHGRKIATLS